MKITYDKEAKALYIKLTDAGKIQVQTVQENDSVNLDYLNTDKSETLVGIEILNVEDITFEVKP